MSRDQARTAIRMAKEVHEGARHLPLEIIENRRQIAEATRKAELFMLKLRMVDEGMIHDVVRLMLERDRLYAEWVESESPS